MGERLHYKAKNVKIRQYKEATMRDYVVKFYAARYLWNLGYRSIGFDVEVLPYGKFDIVATKNRFSKEVAIVDCITSVEEYVLKTHNPSSLKEKKEELTKAILQETDKLLKMEKILGVKVDITQDKNWCDLANNLRKVYSDLKRGGLYWHMLHTYPVATEHWVFCYETLYRKIDSSHLQGWGLVVLNNGLFEMQGKTHRKKKPEEIELRIPTEQHIINLDGKIARSLTEDVIGSKELTAEHFGELFKLVARISGIADKGIAQALIKENGGHN